MLLVDLAEGVIIQDEIVKYKMASSSPYRKWLEANRDSLQVQPLEQKESRRFHCEISTSIWLHGGRSEASDRRYGH